MSVIVMIVKDPADLNQVTMAVRRATGAGIGPVRQRLQAGQPIFEGELFTNDYDAQAHTLRRLLDEVPGTGARLKIYELPEEERFPSPRQREISARVLQNILDEADREGERQSGLDADDGDA